MEDTRRLLLATRTMTARRTGFTCPLCLSVIVQAERGGASVGAGEGQAPAGAGAGGQGGREVAADAGVERAEAGGFAGLAGQAEPGGQGHGQVHGAA